MDSDVAFSVHVDKDQTTTAKIEETEGKSIDPKDLTFISLTRETDTTTNNGGIKFKQVELNPILAPSPRVQPQEEEEAENPSGGGQINASYCSNVVRTSKYKWWSFLPVFLYLTFTKVANVYFLAVGIFQMIREISPTGGVPLQFLPLSIVVIIDGIFAAYEDYKRHQADHCANSTEVDVFDRETLEFVKHTWKDVQVGDLVRLYNRETIPADLLILSVGVAENELSDDPTCYVETKSLDGETNLKLRQAPLVVFHQIDAANVLKISESIRGTLECELPNGDVHNFSGTLTLDGRSDPIPISIENMLLRGCKLRNTHHIYGLVVNTGADSKIVMSSGIGDAFPVKKSSIEVMTNRQVGIVVGVLVTLCLLAAIGNELWTEANQPWYLKSPASFIKTFFTILTTLASIVPITLYVSITMVKGGQVYFMQQDLAMYDAATDSQMQARNMQLNEQLGQISHIFSDKTGTLTCNKMEFRKCSINGISYGVGTTDIGLAAATRDDFQSLKESVEEKEEDPAADVQDMLLPPQIPNVNFKDIRLFRDLVQGARGPTQQALIELFLLHLSLCHSVLIEQVSDDRKERIMRVSSLRRPSSCHASKEDGDMENDPLDIQDGDESDNDSTDLDTDPTVCYSASSPDEQALVSAAKYFGYEFIERLPGLISIRRPDGEQVTYHILHVFEFNSDRKRMSVIVQQQSKNLSSNASNSNPIQMFVKGADNVILERCLVPQTEQERDIHVKTWQHIEQYARDGLRTLMLAYKEISTTDWLAFNFQYNTALADLTQVSLKSRNDERNDIDRLQNSLEVGLTLLGATAIEDRLQDGVPETMEKLSQAGIRLWMLTGDCSETAINIGFACRVLDNSVERIVIDSLNFSTRESILECLDEHYRAYRKGGNKDSDVALVIDGSSLSRLLDVTLMDVKEDPDPTECPHETFPESHVESPKSASAVHLPQSSTTTTTTPEDSWARARQEKEKLVSLHFLRLTLMCKVVIACRVSPQQKAKLVTLMKTYCPGIRTLAIGDGNNDVPMIQSADVGVGIIGEEGLQAVNSSDFALGQFRFLLPLLLVHGRWNYRRIAHLIVFTFYKNIAYCVALFWYIFALSGYSGTMLYSAFIQQGYNLFFTAVPIVIYAVTDQDVTAAQALAHPQLYATGPANVYFNYVVFWKWIGLGLVDSIFILYLPIYGLSGSQLENGQTLNDLLIQGSIGWTVLCVVVNLRFALLVNAWKWIDVVGLALSFIGIYVFQYIVDFINWREAEVDYDTRSFPLLFQEPNFYLIQVLLVVIVLWKDFLWLGYKRAFRPEFVHLVQEVAKFPSLTSVDSITEWKVPKTTYADLDYLDTLVDYKFSSTSPSTLREERSQSYRGFAFDQPSTILDLIKNPLVPFFTNLSIIPNSETSSAFNRSVSITADDPPQRSTRTVRATSKSLDSGNNASWLGRGPRRGSIPDLREQVFAPSSTDRVLFENQRYQPFYGFGSSYPGHLLMTDRSRFSDRSGKLHSMDVDTSGLHVNRTIAHADEDGWVYARDFKMFDKRESRYQRGFVRRREWIEEQEEASDKDVTAPPLPV